MALKQWTAPAEYRVTITDGNGLYADVIITFAQYTERSLVEAILRSPNWYVVNNASRNKPAQPSDSVAP